MPKTPSSVPNPGMGILPEEFTDNRKAMEFHQKTFFAFVDFRAAFDSVDRDALWKILASTGLPKKYYRFFKALLHGTESCVQANDRCNPFF
jgi:hypothetical protein